MARERPALTGILDTVAFRYSSYDTPLWSRNNTVAGRWHRVGDGATQYVTLHPDGAWAELARAEDLRTDADLRTVRMPIWALMINQQNLVDYTSFEKAEAVDFSAEALVDDDYTRCQDEGRQLRDLGYAGVVAPSAALPGTLNVTIFGRRMLSTWGSTTRLASSVPGCVVAVGAPPLGISSRVRYFGAAHAGLVGYEEGLVDNVRVEQFRPEEPEAQHRRFGSLDDSLEEDDSEE